MKPKELYFFFALLLCTNRIGPLYSLSKQQLLVATPTFCRLVPLRFGLPSDAVGHISRPHRPPRQSRPTGARCRLGAAAGGGGFASEGSRPFAGGCCGAACDVAARVAARSGEWTAVPLTLFCFRTKLCLARSCRHPLCCRFPPPCFFSSTSRKFFFGGFVFGASETSAMACL